MEFIDNEADASRDDSDGSSSADNPPAFRINAQRFLLTYPHYNQTPSEVLRLLNLVKPIRKGISCLELHQDGEPHVHAAIEFERRINSVNRRIFDLEGHHPNIQTARNWGACANYCRKEGTIEVGVFGAASPEDVVRLDPGADGAPSTPRNLFELARNCNSLPEWIQICCDHRISAAYSKWIWDIENGDRPPDFAANIPLPDEVTDFRLRATVWGDNDRSLVICGPSGIGKTSWAMANIPCGAVNGRGPNKWLLVTHIDDLRHFDPRVHRSILFDEIRWDGAIENERRVGKRPLQDQIKVLTWDTPVSIHCRYGVARIPAHIIKIFTCTNSICFTSDEQTRRRVRVMNLYAPDRSIDELWES